MREDQPPHSQAETREQRLAAKLRENLKRRKEQAREIARSSDADPSQEGE